MCNAVAQIPVVGRAYSLFQLDTGAPAEIVDAGGVHSFHRRTVGALWIEHQLALEADDVANDLRELADAHIATDANVDDLLVVIYLHQVQTSGGAVIDVAEFAARRARAPYCHAIGAGELGLVKFAQQRRQYVRTQQIEIVPRSVEIGGHGGNVAAIVLATIRLA